MEKRYKIGLFFVLILISVLMVVLMWKRHTMDGFPDESDRVEQDQAESDTSGADDQTPRTAEEIYQVQKMNVSTTADTICIYENIDKKDGSMSVEVVKLLPKYIGLNRTELEQLLAEDSLEVDNALSIRRISATVTLPMYRSSLLLHTVTICSQRAIDGRSAELI